MCPDKASKTGFPDQGPGRPSACLFPPLPADAARLLEGYGQLVDEVLDLKPKHRRELPENIRQLSHELTDERALGFAPKYMSDAASLSAYVSFFLPWNLYRLSRLLAGLELDLPDGAVCVDLGSGPLTMVQALWLAKPELRGRELRFFCVDRAGKPMRVGQDLFSRLAGPETPWRTELVQGGLGARLPAKASLLTAANVLNELGTRTGEGREERMAQGLSRQTNADARLLLVEPGTRTGGRLLSSLREELAEEGFVPLAPCTHVAECPMPGTAGKPWCHFQFGTVGVPQWLTRLSEEAGFRRRGVALSFLYAGRGAAARTPAGVRLISDVFELPDAGQLGRYGCAEAGLVLAAGDELALRRLPSGCLWQPRWPEEPARDAKSGALMLPVEGARGEGRAQRPQDLPQGRSQNADKPAQGRAAKGKKPKSPGMLKVRNMAVQAFREGQAGEGPAGGRKGRSKGEPQAARAEDGKAGGFGKPARKGHGKPRGQGSETPAPTGKPRPGKGRQEAPAGAAHGDEKPFDGRSAGKPSAKAKGHDAQSRGQTARQGDERPGKGRGGKAGQRSGDRFEGPRGQRDAGESGAARRKEHGPRGGEQARFGKQDAKGRQAKGSFGRQDSFAGAGRQDRGDWKPAGQAPKARGQAHGGRGAQDGTHAGGPGGGPHRGRKGGPAGQGRGPESGRREGHPRFQAKGPGAWRGAGAPAGRPGFDSRATREQSEYERQLREGQERSRRERGEPDVKDGREERGEQGRQSPRRGRKRGRGSGKGGGR